MILNDIIGYLETQGFGTFKIDMFGVAMPDSPDDCICIFNTGGSSPSLTFDNSNVDYPSFQIISRSRDYTNAFTKLENIYKKLNGNTDLFMLIKAEQYPEGIGRDENGRHEVSCNFTIIKNM